jgi:hypothetical protein
VVRARLETQAPKLQLANTWRVSTVTMHFCRGQSMRWFEGDVPEFPVDDLDLVYRLGTTGPFVQITEPSTTWHRSHTHQVIRQTGRIIEGTEWLIANDKRGRYPGGDLRRLERRACIGGIALYWAGMHAKVGSRRRAFRFLVRNSPYVGAAVAARVQRTIRGRKTRHTEALATCRPSYARIDR